MNFKKFLKLFLPIIVWKIGYFCVYYGQLILLFILLLINKGMRFPPLLDSCIAWGFVALENFLMVILGFFMEKNLKCNFLGIIIGLAAVFYFYSEDFYWNNNETVYGIYLILEPIVTYLFFSIGYFWVFFEKEK